MRILQPKNASLKGAKNHRVKKVIKSKNDWSKSCSKFCKLVDEFFLFWRNLKNEAATAEKQYFDNVYYIHNKSCIFSPGAPKNQNFSKRLHRHHILTYWDGLEPFLIWVMGGGPPAPQRSKNSPPHEGLIWLYPILMLSMHNISLANCDACKHNIDHTQLWCLLSITFKAQFLK